MLSGKYAVLFFALVLVCAFFGGAIASEYGAVMDGPWGSAPTWTPSGGPPAATDTAWIGSMQPLGSAAVATVTLDASRSVQNLYLGNGAGTDGTLDLAGNQLTTSTVHIGLNQSHGELVHNEGAITASAFVIDGDNEVLLAAADTVHTLTLNSGAHATTAANTNLTGSAYLSGPNSQLTMMADLALGGHIGIGGGTPGAPAILDANGHDVIMQPNTTLSINGPAELRNDGALTVSQLILNDRPFELDDNDTVTYIVANNSALTIHPTTQAYSLQLNGSSSTTLFATNQFQYLTVANSQATTLVATNNVTGGLSISGANTELTLTADLNLGNRLWIGGGVSSQPAVLSANGQDVTAREIWIGQGGPGELHDEGFVTAAQLLRVFEDSSLRGGFDQVGGTLQIDNNATFHVTQEEDHARGLSLDGGTLEITGQGVLQLEFDAVQDPFGEWTFRWAGDRVAAIESMLSSGRIVVQSPHAFSVVNNGDGYTYIARFQVDFNQDGRSNCDDLAVLGAAIVAGSTDLQFDLTGDGQVTTADRNAWLEGAGRIFLRSGNSYLPGDANLDGVVDGSDFGVWNSHKFTTNPSWCEGDFNTDGFVDGSDFGIWNSNKFTSANGLIAVPEPAGYAVFSALIVGSCLARRRSAASAARCSRFDHAASAGRNAPGMYASHLVPFMGSIAILTGVLSNIVHAAPLRTIALTGQEVPGSTWGPIVDFGIQRAARINSHGQTAFDVGLVDETGARQSAILRETQGEFQRLGFWALTMTDSGTPHITRRVGRADLTMMGCWLSMPPLPMVPQGSSLPIPLPFLLQRLPSRT